MGCPTRQTIRQSLDGELNEDSSTQVFEHIESCDKCEQVVTELEASICGSLKGLNKSNPDIDRREDLVETIEQWSKAHAIPQQIRDYQLIEPIGEGGMGLVFRAMHRRLKKEVALKIVRRTRRGGAEAAARFAQEIEATGRLSHPNIVAALDAGEQDGVHYLVMELVDGVDARRKIQEQGPILVEEAADIIRQASIGLGVAHAAGFVHRDIKPSNLMIGNDGRVRVLDFGLASLSEFVPATNPSETQTKSSELTRTGQEIGTPLYMSPEQRSGQKVLAPTDVYSLGSTLHYLLTGEPARNETISDQLSSSHDGIYNLLAQMLKTNPGDRPSMVQVQTQLAQLLSATREERLNPPIPSRLSTRFLLLSAFALMLAAVTVFSQRPASTFSRGDFGADGSQKSKPVVASAEADSADDAQPKKLVFAPEKTDLVRLPITKRHDATASWIALGDKGKYLLAFHDDGVITQEDFPSRYMCNYYYHLENLKSGDASDENPAIAALDRNGQILYVPDADPRGTLQTLYMLGPELFANEGSASCLKLAQGGKDIFVGFDSGNILRITPGERVVATWRCDLAEPVQRLLVGKKRLAAVGDTTTWIVELSSRKQRALPLSAQAMAANKLQTRFLFAADSGEIMLYDAEASKTVGKFAVTSGPPTAVCFLPDDQFFVVGTGSGEVLLFDVASVEPLFRYTIHKAAIKTVIPTPDGSHIVSCSADKSIQVTQLPFSSGQFIPEKDKYTKQKLVPIDTEVLAENAKPQFFFIRPPRLGVRPNNYRVGAAGQIGNQPVTFGYIGKNLKQLQERRPDLGLTETRRRRVNILEIEATEANRDLVIRTTESLGTTVHIEVRERGGEWHVYEFENEEELEQKSPEFFRVFRRYQMPWGLPRASFPPKKNREDFFPQVTKYKSEMSSPGLRKMTLEYSKKSLELVERTNKFEFRIADASPNSKPKSYVAKSADDLVRRHPELEAMIREAMNQWTNTNEAANREQRDPDTDRVKMFLGK